MERNRLKEKEMLVTNQNALSLLFTGSTHYLATEPGKEAVIYYGTGDQAHMRLPGGQQWRGVWRLTPTGYHVDWADGPSAGWQIDAEPGHLAYLDKDESSGAGSRALFPGMPRSWQRDGDARTVDDAA